MHTLGCRTFAAGAALGLGALLAVAVWSVASERMAARLLDMDEACAQGRPYLVAVCHDIGVAADVDRGRLPALVVFRDSPDSRGHLGLAATDELGSLWGLAYSRSERALYAGAFRRRGVELGPGGIGAIYRIDLVTGKAAEFAHVAGAAPNEPITGGRDVRALDEVSRTGLGDLDVNEDESLLLAVSLGDRQIYRYALPSGQLLGSFAHGAAAESWAAEARPFGLAVSGGRVYHGLVRSAERDRQDQDLEARVYSSLPDGTDMRLELRFGLAYDRGGWDSWTLFPWPWGRWMVFDRVWDWHAWSDRDWPARQGRRVEIRPMPILSDIAFDASGRMLLALRDRTEDLGISDDAVFFASPISSPSIQLILFAGDLIRAHRDASGWTAELQPEPFDDGLPGSDEGEHGGLAIQSGAGQVMALMHQLYDPGARLRSLQPAAVWFDTATGQSLVAEPICLVDRPYHADWPLTALAVGAETALAHNEWVQWVIDSTGDLEVLCGPELVPTITATVPPTPSREPPPTGTAAPPLTPTVTRTATPTAEPSATATPVPLPLYLPLALREHCAPGTRRMDVALVIDASTTMRDDLTSAGRSTLSAAIEAAAAFVATMALPPDQAAVVAFNQSAEVVQPLTGRRADVNAALARIPRLVRQQTRIDLGIAKAHEELTSARHEPVNDLVLILLTDGLANPEPASTAIRRAQAAKDDHITVFTIGLGQPAELDVAELEQMASRPEYFYLAPDGEDLAEIYRTIAVEIPCPASQYWAGR